ncbi:hypothetical protein GGR53DRAFT_493754 [Hypoxylon sp. FL1150]|nr:hypothetical protein GGR53DRAFT_493754 [Hypoxylon sp. FL1150]
MYGKYDIGLDSTTIEARATFSPMIIVHQLYWVLIIALVFMGCRFHMFPTRVFNVTWKERLLFLSRGFLDALVALACNTLITREVEECDCFQKYMAIILFYVYFGCWLFIPSMEQWQQANGPARPRQSFH